MAPITCRVELADSGGGLPSDFGVQKPEVLRLTVQFWEMYRSGFYESQQAFKKSVNILMAGFAYVVKVPSLWEVVVMVKFCPLVATKYAQPSFNFTASKKPCRVGSGGLLLPHWLRVVTLRPLLFPGSGAIRLPAWGAVLVVLLRWQLATNLAPL